MPLYFKQFVLQNCFVFDGKFVSLSKNFHPYTIIVVYPVQQERNDVVDPHFGELSFFSRFLSCSQLWPSVTILHGHVSLPDQSIWDQNSGIDGPIRGRHLESEEHSEIRGAYLLLWEGCQLHEGGVEAGSCREVVLGSAVRDILKERELEKKKRIEGCGRFGGFLESIP